VGQDAAVTAVSEAVLRARAGMAGRNRPTGSFLFLGPTGVGKTELAKALAWELFDDDRHIVRLDMSEYMEKHSVARLIGAPPGYVGHDQGGQLTEAVRRRPYNVILFDEIEKAHRDVWNVLLQVLDDGRLTDSKGRTVDFSNTCIILTSNLGAEHLLDVPTDSTLEQASHKRRKLDAMSSARKLVMNEVSLHFRPEFLNRLDDIVVFEPLDRDQLSKIANIQLKTLEERLSDRDVSLRMNRTGLQFVLQEAFDPKYGARPIRRYLEKSVTTELSKWIIAGNLQEHTIVTISSPDGTRLQFSSEPKQPSSDFGGEV